MRSALTRTLPDHMFPARIVALQSLPMTPSGKVDRRALMALSDTADRGALEEDQAPQGELEEAIAAEMNSFRARATAAAVCTSTRPR